MSCNPLVLSYLVSACERSEEAVSSEQFTLLDKRARESWRGVCLSLSITGDIGVSGIEEVARFFDPSLWWEDENEKESERTPMISPGTRQKLSLFTPLFHSSLDSLSLSLSHALTLILRHIPSSPFSWIAAWRLEAVITSTHYYPKEFPLFYNDLNKFFFCSRYTWIIIITI